MASSGRMPFGTRRDANVGSLLRSGVSAARGLRVRGGDPRLRAECDRRPRRPRRKRHGSGSGDQAATCRERRCPTAMTRARSSSPAFARASQNSQNIKRNSDTVVDVITAQDIGALPDRSVTEALQRVPGVAMNRFAGTSDPDHFSAEGSGVVIRGLTFVRSEFNGRDTFSTGVYGQAINFQDVPAELLGSVEVYKEDDRRQDRGRPFRHRQHEPAPAVRPIRASTRLRRRGDLRRLRARNGRRSDRCWSATPGTRASAASACSAPSPIRSCSPAPTASRSPTSRRATAPMSSSNRRPPARLSGLCRTPLPAGTDTTGFPPVFRERDVGPACYGAASGPARTALGRLLAAGTSLCAARRPVPDPGFRPQAPRHRRRRAVGEPRPPRAPDGAVPAIRTRPTDWGEHTFEAGSDLSEYNTFPAGCLPER